VPADKLHVALLSLLESHPRCRSASASLPAAAEGSPTPTTAMTRTAIQETLNGKSVDSMEKVSDEQYRR
jgi:hypothetical protein